MAVLYPVARYRLARNPGETTRPESGASARPDSASGMRCGAPGRRSTDRLDTPARLDAPAWSNALARSVASLRRDTWLPQLVRFALVGGFSNIGYFLLFLACYGGGPQLANLIGSVASTALANELHRRLTFHAADRVGWFAAQLEGGGVALAGLALTSASLAVLDVVAPGLGNVAEAVAVILITLAVGTLRFLTLRIWVF